MHAPIISIDSLTPSTVLLDARTREAYVAGHIENAIHADVDVHLSAARDREADPAHGGRHPLPPLDRWLRQLGEWGIGPEMEVVVYDDQAGANAAARAWWMLRSVGHERVSVLDGGFPAAVAAGWTVTTKAPHIVVRAPYPAERWQRPVVDLDDVNRLRRDAEWKVLDVRSSPRYRGETEPIDPIAGHIPGALNLPFAENLDGALFKSPDALRAQYEQFLGTTSADHLIVHCGSGVTACHTLLALEAAGLHGASLYVGSWSEWCRNDLPRLPGS